VWHEHPGNAELVRRLRAGIEAGGRVLVFLGAGLSFGAARQGGRATFDNEKYRPYPPFDRPEWALSSNDDGLPLPSWPWLVSRMQEQLIMHAESNEHGSLQKFFRDEGPLDCAQLFRQTVGDANYREFLLNQFDVGRHPFVGPTPSHAALIRLGLPLIFTTNYDELIETAHLQAGVQLRVTVTEEQFLARRSDKPRRHLVKLHGSIDQPDTIVLTRSDYARSRVERKEMLASLRSEMAETSFLFVGFSLSDPNFGLLHDDIRLVYGMNTPASFTVQGRRDPVKQRYLLSMDVNTIWLGDWNFLPDFLRRINPAVEEAS
jgi:NAD-dependent SIR2 family protein deacetylase